jgi:acyl-CoA hydrolase
MGSGGRHVTAWRESVDGAAVIACVARLTFVALDETGRPVSVRDTASLEDALQTCTTHRAAEPPRSPRGNSDAKG